VYYYTNTQEKILFSLLSPLVSNLEKRKRRKLNINIIKNGGSKMKKFGIITCICFALFIGNTKKYKHSKLYNLNE